MMACVDDPEIGLAQFLVQRYAAVGLGVEHADRAKVEVGDVEYFARDLRFRTGGRLGDALKEVEIGHSAG